MAYAKMESIAASGLPTLLTRFAEQHLLSDRGDVHAFLIEDVPDRQTPRSGVVMAGEIVQVPSVGAHWAMEPDRVVEADSRQMLLWVALIHRLMGGANGVTRQIVRHICQPALMNKWLVGALGVRKLIGDFHPGCYSSGTIAWGALYVVLRDESSIKMGRERRVLDTVGGGHDREWNRLQLGRLLGSLERTLGIEDRPDGWRAITRRVRKLLPLRVRSTS
jgi:hypothetical protein